MQWDFFAKDTIGKQLVRSSDSIGANMRKGLAGIIIKRTKISVTLAEVQLLKPKVG
ncbi:MAG: hypothetical protein JWR12_846 [Mucilaginibacter sp.]|nr:hypothetical protein [Mucilaginibacter sp.]